MLPFRARLLLPRTDSAPRARACKLRTESVATSLPLLMITTCSQVCSTSGRMWVLENNGVLARQVLDQIAGFVDLLGIQAGGRFIENQYVGIVDDGLRESRRAAGNLWIICR